MSGPKLNVGLPVRDGEAFVAEAIGSILAQTFSDFQLIISDNASTDGTEEICRHYARVDSRVSYHRQSTNVGAAANYNFTFQKATGEYFRWSAHDDLVEPTMFERCVLALENDPNAVLAYPRTRLSFGDAESEERYEDHLDLLADRPHLRLRRLVSNLDLCNAIFGVIRSNTLRQTRLIGPFASSDEVLLAELALLGRFVEVPEYLFIRRLHSARSTVAHAQISDRTAWFDPSARHRRHLHRTKVLLEDVKSVWSIDLSTRQRLSSTVCLFRGYLPRWWQIMARELQHAVLP